MKHVNVLTLATLFLVVATSAGLSQAQEARVHGSVTDDKGQPVAQAKIVLEPVADSGGSRTAALSSRRGTFLISSVRPGTYLFMLEVPGQVLVAVQARGVDVEKKEVWAIDGRPMPGVPPTIQLGDGFEATINVSVGQAVAVATESGGAAQMTPDQALRMAAELVQKGDYAGALPRIDSILEAGPSLARAHYLRGYCLGLAEQDEPSAAALGRALELNPKFEGAALLRGQILQRLGRSDEAVAMFRQELALTQNPQIRSEALIGIGVVYEDQKKDDEALEIFEQVATLTPARPEPYLEMAAILTRLGQPERVKAVLERSQKMGASSPEAFLNIGISHFNKKEYERAGEMFRQVLAMPSASLADQAMAHALVGKLLLRDGKIDDAVGELKKSLELHPDGPLAQETRDRLKAMKR